MLDQSMELLIHLQALTRHACDNCEEIILRTSKNLSLGIYIVMELLELVSHWLIIGSKTSL